MTPTSLHHRLALARLPERDVAQAAYREDIAARGVVAVVAPYVSIPAQRKASE